MPHHVHSPEIRAAVAEALDEACGDRPHLAIAKQLGIHENTVKSCRQGTRRIALEDFCLVAQAVNQDPAKVLHRGLKKLQKSEP